MKSRWDIHDPHNPNLYTTSNPQLCSKPWFLTVRLGPAPTDGSPKDDVPPRRRVDFYDLGRTAVALVNVAGREQQLVCDLPGRWQCQESHGVGWFGLSHPVAVTRDDNGTCSAPLCDW